MIVVLGILSFIFFSTTIFLSWYAFNSLQKNRYMLQAIEELDMDFQAFQNHLKYIYELDMYYGDQTLEGLIKHTHELNNAFSEFRQDYNIFNGEIDEEEFFDEEEKNDTTEKNNAGQNLLFKRS